MRKSIERRTRSAIRFRNRPDASGPTLVRTADLFRLCNLPCEDCSVVAPRRGRARNEAEQPR
jgi:hypothetical protein